MLTALPRLRSCAMYCGNVSNSQVMPWRSTSNDMPSTWVRLRIVMSRSAGLHGAMVKGLGKADVRDKIALQGMDATPSATPAAFEAEVKKETPYWEKLAHDSGAKVE